LGLEELGKGATEDEGADALGTTNLMEGKGDKVGGVTPEIGGKAAKGLNGIGVEEGAMGMGGGGKGREIIDAARLIVGMHDGDEGEGTTGVLLSIITIVISALIDKAE
jgi:hypothetical protein